MTSDEPVKSLLHARLREDRETLWRKASGLPEWLQRRPVTDTGTDLLGLVLHVALVEADYFGSCWGDPVPDLPPYAAADATGFAPDDDLWAFQEETPEQVFAIAERVAAHTDALVAAHALGDPAHVPWWGPHGRDVTLAELLVHLLDETARHLGHADLAGELLDGTVGYREGDDNLPAGRTPEQWRERGDRLTAVADSFRPAAPRDVAP